jgi:NAD(P)-dependent dehydrogenase (short-subunit alcohol dehydrogenase family)
LVTGAAGALGSELVRALVERGHCVVALDHHEERLTELAQKLGLSRDATSGWWADENVLALPLDARSSDDWREVLSAATDWRLEQDPQENGTLVGRGAEEIYRIIDGAVLTAGGWRGGAPLYAPEAGSAWQAMFDSNLETARQALQALLPPMVKAGRGRVVLIGSRAAVRPWESANAAAYAAAKAAVVALVQAVAAEVLDSGVRVNAVLPSVIDTPANRRAMPKADPSRWVSTASLARVISFLLSDDSLDISGAAIPVYGRA